MKVKMNKVLIILLTLGLSNGAPTDESDDRIVGGVNAAPGEFKYQVSFRVKPNSHNCGGSVINHHTMLCAAHCFIKIPPMNYIAVVGTNKLNSGGTVYQPTKFIIHPDYDPMATNDDIALALFEVKIMFNELVQPIRLPSRFTGGDVRVVLSGWGKANYTDILPNDLQKAYFKTITNSECEKLMDLKIDKQICTSPVLHIGSCNGDSGGPLVDNGEIVGIVSFGRIICGSGYPDVYTRVGSYLDWINSNKM